MSDVVGLTILFVLIVCLAVMILGGFIWALVASGAESRQKKKAERTQKRAIVKQKVYGPKGYGTYERFYLQLVAEDGSYAEMVDSETLFARLSEGDVVDVDLLTFVGKDGSEENWFDIDTVRPTS